MTNIGQTLCLVCGQISCEQVFYYSTLNVAITVAKKLAEPVCRLRFHIRWENTFRPATRKTHHR